MRALYREQTILHGDFATVSLYPVFPTGRKRRGRYRATNEVQQRLNEFNARERLGRQLDEHMHNGDGWIMLSFADQYLPTSRKECILLWQAFRRRLLRHCQRAGLGEIKIAAVCHGDVGGKRLHIHFVVSADLSPATIRKLWGLGRVDVKPVEIDPRTGLRGLAEYMMRDMEWGRVMTTRNLTDPQPKERTGQISKAKVQDIHDTWNDPEPYEGLIPGYSISEVKPFYNWFNHFYYLRVYLRRKE